MNQNADSSQNHKIKNKQYKVKWKKKCTTWFAMTCDPYNIRNDSMRCPLSILFRLFSDLWIKRDQNKKNKDKKEKEKEEENRKRREKKKEKQEEKKRREEEGRETFEENIEEKKEEKKEEKILDGIRILKDNFPRC